MSETTSPTAEGTAPQGQEATIPAPTGSTGLTTQSGFWALRAAQMANKDTYVPIKDWLFDKQSTPAVISEVEPVAADADGSGQAVKVVFTHENELTSIEGIKKSPGTWRPRFAYTIENNDEPEQAERGLRDLGKLLQAAGLVSEAKVPQVGEIVANLDRLKGAGVIMRFVVQDGRKRDAETGQVQKFQNVYFSRPGAAGGAAGGELKKLNY